MSKIDLYRGDCLEVVPKKQKGYQLKPVRCENCIFFKRYKNTGEGTCKKDARYTREHRVCNLLATNEDRRNAKINLYR